MKNHILLLFALLMMPLLSLSQEKAEEEIVDKPERAAFDSSTLIENPTNVLFKKKTLEVMMQHRFGLISEENSLLGIYGANSNIRIALSYAILDWITVGYGITKKNRISDFNLKVGILQQTRSGKIPLSISYYGNVGIDGRSGSANDGVFFARQDRFTYFHQIILARRFSPKISIQIAPSLSHYNVVDFGSKNDRISVAFGGRIKVSPQTSVIVDYSQPITSLPNNTTTGISYNNPGISLGAEFMTSAHAFQLFITNYSGIVSQQNYMKNTNDFFGNGILIGFNITRKYNF